jgi:hypothetical protein
VQQGREARSPAQTVLTSEGRLPIALVTGKDSIQRLCKKLKRPFVAEVGRDAEVARQVA